MTPSRRGQLIQDIYVAIQDEQAQGAILSNAIASRLDLTSTELEVLGTLQARGPIAAGELSRRTGLTSGAVTRLIDRMEARGFMHRLGDKSDRRRVLVELTPLARKASEVFYAPIQKEGTALLERLTDRELETVLKYLTTGYAFLLRHTARVEAMPERPHLPRRKVNIKGRILGQTVRIKI